jgi:AcrR family transcriptional regulator
MSSSARSRILEAAESLFAENGFTGTTLRHITEAAGTNVASVNYHFGSKDNLILEVLRRPLAQARAAQVESLRQLRAQGRVPTLRQVVEALVAPWLSATADGRKGQATVRLLGRMLVEADPETRQRAALEAFAGEEELFELLASCLPEVPRRELLFRFKSMVGAVIFHQFDLPSLGAGGSSAEPSSEELQAWLIEFLVDGLSASPSALRPRKGPAHGSGGGPRPDK